MGQARPLPVLVKSTVGALSVGTAVTAESALAAASVSPLARDGLRRGALILRPVSSAPFIPLRARAGFVRRCPFFHEPETPGFGRQLVFDDCETSFRWRTMRNRREVGRGGLGKVCADIKYSSDSPALRHISHAVNRGVMRLSPDALESTRTPSN